MTLHIPYLIRACTCAAACLQAQGHWHQRAFQHLLPGVCMLVNTMQKLS